MSIVDPVTIGDVRFTPVDFTGLTVSLRLEAVTRQSEGTEDIYTEVGNQPENDTPDLCRPQVPIAVWESLQEGAASLAAYRLAFQPNGAPANAN